MSVVRFARARLGGVTYSEEWRVDQVDYGAHTLSNYGRTFQVQVTTYLNELGQNGIALIDPIGPPSLNERYGLVTTVKNTQSLNETEITDRTSSL
jgi:hypothetical protein